MTSREEELAGKLGVYLDQATADLKPGLAYRLQAARAQALSRLAEGAEEAGTGQLAGAHGLVGAGAGGGSFKTAEPRPVLSQGRLWTAIGLLALALFGWQQWTAWQELAELEDLDAQILTSDLPIDALVDRGFHLFLEMAPAFVAPEAPPDAGEAAEGTKAETAPAATKPAE